MSVKNRLKEIVDASGLTLKEVSERCDMPYRTLQNYLLTDREPSAKALTSLSTYLGVSIDWLLTGEGEMYRMPGSGNTSIHNHTTRDAPRDLGCDALLDERLTPRQRAVLELFTSLSEGDQREILRDAEKKKRLSELEKHYGELREEVERLKNFG